MFDGPQFGMLKLVHMCPQVIAVWDELEARDYGYKGLPKYALGVSSGGAMALVLAQFFPLQVLSLLLCRPGVCGLCPRPHANPQKPPQLWACHPA